MGFNPDISQKSEIKTGVKCFFLGLNTDITQKSEIETDVNSFPRLNPDIQFFESENRTCIRKWKEGTIFCGNYNH
jgi:hypothetical protein